MQLKQLHTQQRGAQGTVQTVVVVVVVQTLQEQSRQQWHDIYLILIICSIY
jgi:hypothetical protein